MRGPHGPRKLTFIINIMKAMHSLDLGFEIPISVWADNKGLRAHVDPAYSYEGWLHKVLY